MNLSLSLLSPRLAAFYGVARYAADPRRHGWRNELYDLRLEHLTLRFPGLPPALAGLRIAHLSDLHTSRWIQADYLRSAANLVLAQRPDLIVLTGDFIHHERDVQRHAAECARGLASLRAPLGVFAVLGNHDYWGNPDLVMRAFREVGIPTLVNRACRVAVGDDALWLIGLDDARHGLPDLPAALADVPDGAFTVLLAHEPDVADVAQGYGVHLQLSGHSHGGQVHIPGVPTTWLPLLGRKYPRGLYRVGGMWLYTSRGLGSAFPPIRHNCPPEVALLQLERG
ncbi:MAG: metallophosphoesterase [Anaerolineae bacterium]|nr:metallophosphoesterase [Anaerolineae bacterium]